jgi:hypothetical protein
MHPSLQLAHAILDLAGVLLHEDETRDFDVCSFSNCREQGLMVRAGGRLPTAPSPNTASATEIVTFTSGDVEGLRPRPQAD